MRTYNVKLCFALKDLHQLLTDDKTKKSFLYITIHSSTVSEMEKKSWSQNTYAKGYVTTNPKMHEVKMQHHFN